MRENLTKVSTYCISQPSFSDRGQMPTSNTRTKYGFISQKKALKGRVASLNSSHVPVSFLGHKTSFPEASQQLPLTSHWADTATRPLWPVRKVGTPVSHFRLQPPVRVSEGERGKIGPLGEQPGATFVPHRVLAKTGFAGSSPKATSISCNSLYCHS